jgi:hypothetical protein
MTAVQYVASALIKAWFPKRHNQQDWLISEDGQNWQEIALLDASIAIDAHLKWQELNGDDLK